jgi:hypothetical protein
VNEDWLFRWRFKATTDPGPYPKTMESRKMNQYDQFSLDYHWLYSDNVLSGKPFLEQFGNLLDSMPSDSRLFDCSCGIGVHVVALAQRVFFVWGKQIPVLEDLESNLNYTLYSRVTKLLNSSSVTEFQKKKRGSNTYKASRCQ